MLVAMALWEANHQSDVLISNGLATMGYALPAAIGAALGSSDGGPVVCLTGDGGLGMCLSELETLARLALPVVVVVFNDAKLSLIAVKQRPTGHGGSGAVDYLKSDFALVARGLGLAAATVHDETEMRAVAKSAFEGRDPFLVDARIDSSGYPQVFAGLRG